METQTVVVTGASAGIGRATARLFAERGASVGLIARGQAGLDAAAREVEKASAPTSPTTSRSPPRPSTSSRHSGRSTCG
jgi:short-subunit dehydrogenase